MRIEELLEAPLPSDWDQDIYDQRVPFTQRVRYAKERAEQVGRGSSRVAFKIPYQGRPTVLKIAMNRKGMAQNEAESQLLDDWMVKSTGIVIPVIDYDERNSTPTWIHTEFASKVNGSQLKRFFGADLDVICRYFDSRRRPSYYSVTLPEEVHENEYFQRLQDLVINFDLPAGDFSRPANWGLYRNEPVIIDVGYTNDTEKLYQ